MSARGVSVHRASDAEDLKRSDFMRPVESSPPTAQAFAEVLAAGLAAGSVGRVLVRQSPDEGGFSLVHLWYKPGYPLVRHTHDVACLYYVLSGAAHLGRVVVRAGDSFYVPEGAPYRYTAGDDGVEILEIRHGVTEFGMTIPDATDGVWAQMRDAAIAHGEEWASLGDVSPTLARAEPSSGDGEAAVGDDALPGEVRRGG